MCRRTHSAPGVLVLLERAGSGPLVGTIHRDKIVWITGFDSLTGSLDSTLVLYYGVWRSWLARGFHTSKVEGSSPSTPIYLFLVLS